MMRMATTCFALALPSSLRALHTSSNAIDIALISLGPKTDTSSRKGLIVSMRDPRFSLALITSDQRQAATVAPCLIVTEPAFAARVSRPAQ